MSKSDLSLLYVRFQHKFLYMGNFTARGITHNTTKLLELTSSVLLFVCLSVCLLNYSREFLCHCQYQLNMAIEHFFTDW